MNCKNFIDVIKILTQNNYEYVDYKYIPTNDGKIQFLLFEDKTGSKFVDDNKVQTLIGPKYKFVYWSRKYFYIRRKAKQKKEY